MVQKWMPQSDILAHPNVILFILHGGMFGSIEGIHRGHPMLFIPIYGDQHRNGIRATQQGYAKVLQFYDVTYSTLKSNLSELIFNKKYSETAKRISALMRDNPSDPMEDFIFWTEYVIRHGGAPHLRSTANNMSFINYMLLDILAVILIGLLLISVLVYKSVRCLFVKQRKSKKKFD